MWLTGECFFETQRVLTIFIIVADDRELTETPGAIEGNGTGIVAADLETQSATARIVHRRFRGGQECAAESPAARGCGDGDGVHAGPCTVAAKEQDDVPDRGAAPLGHKDASTGPAQKIAQLAPAQAVASEGRSLKGDEGCQVLQVGGADTRIRRGCRGVVGHGTESQSKPLL